jgi:hypothetical protein
MDEDHVGVLSRIIRDHAPEGLTVTERNLAEEIDQVVTRTLARPWGQRRRPQPRCPPRPPQRSSAGTC